MDGTNSHEPIPSFAALRLWRKAGREIRIETEGTSMRPLIEGGDEITIKLTNTEPLRVGDLIAFREGNRIVVHRLLKVGRSAKGRRFCEKGDNAPGWSWIDAERVLGRVTSIDGRRGRLVMTRPLWRWINPIVGRLHALGARFPEAGPAPHPPLPGPPPAARSDSRSGLLRSPFRIFNTLGRVLVGCALVAAGLFCSGRSKRV